MCMYSWNAARGRFRVHTPIGIPTGPGPAPIWTRSTHTLDLVHTPPGPGPTPSYRHCATSNAEIHEKCVVRCHDCNEQRANPPKPCCSLQIVQRTTRKSAKTVLLIARFPTPVAQVSASNGAGFPPRWRRFPTPMAQASPSNVAMDRRITRFDPLLWIATILGLRHYAFLPQNA